MAYVSDISSTTTSITVCIRDLSQPTSKYQKFRARRSGGSWVEVNAGSSDLIDGYNPGKWRSPSITITGLTCGTTYTIEGSAYTNTWYSVNSLYGRGTSACPIPTNISSLNATAISKSQINLTWTHATTKEGYNIYQNNTYIGWTSSNSYSVTRLSEYTSYTFLIKSTHSGKESSGVSISKRTLDQTIPTLTVSSTTSTHNSITISWTGSDSHSGFNGVIIWISKPGETTFSISAQTTVYSALGSYTFILDRGNNSLLEDTNYNIKIQGFDNELNYSSSITKTIKTQVSKPDSWVWDNDEITGAITNLKWGRWNAFIDRIILFREYKKLTNPTQVTFGEITYNITSAKVTKQNKTLTALKFNIAKNAIGQVVVTGINDVSSGQPVYGWYFSRLAERLNQF